MVRRRRLFELFPYPTLPLGVRSSVVRPVRAHLEGGRSGSTLVLHNHTHLVQLRRQHLMALYRRRRRRRLRRQLAHHFLQLVLHHHARMGATRLRSADRLGVAER